MVNFLNKMYILTLFNSHKSLNKVTFFKNKIKKYTWNNMELVKSKCSSDLKIMDKSFRSISTSTVEKQSKPYKFDNGRTFQMNSCRPITSDMSTSTWNVINLLQEHKLFEIGRYAVLILNRPINLPKKYVVKLWNEACFHATADGGTDRWYSLVPTLMKEFKLKQIHPDLTSGDFDSVKPETLQYCKEHGVNVVCTPDQCKTDFTKALEEIIKQTHGEIDSVVAVVDNSGRLDHIMANLNTLYNTEEIFGSAAVRLFLLSSDSVTWLLKAGSHTIHIPSAMVRAQATCSLIPLGAPCVVTTSGLKWNLDKDKMEFGGLISSSNTYSDTCEGVVTVETDFPLLWTMNLELEEK